MDLQQRFIADLENSLRHQDHSLLTRRLMDLGEEFQVAPNRRKQVIALRQKFLNHENTDDKSGGLENIQAEAASLLESLKREAWIPSRTSLLPGTELLKAEGISKQFRKGRNPFLLQPLSLSVKAGEITGVVGENGNGKTTLLRILAGELSVDAGALHYPGLSQTSDWYPVKNKLAFIPQRIDRWRGTLLENLKFYASIHGFSGDENLSRIDYILFRLGLDRFRDLSWSEISSGYRLRFELAKMLLWKPALLLLDEPLANLDINAQQLLLQDLRFFSQSQAHPMGILLTSQNLHEIERVADNIIFIRQGETIYNGQQQEFASDRAQNSFEVSGNFDLGALSACFASHPGYSIENAGTSFIISTGTQHSLYTVVKILEHHRLELNYIRDISKSTRKLFHKDI